MPTSAGLPGNSAPRATLLRPLGAFERLYYRYTERNPMHFAVVAEFGTVLAREQVAVALSAVQGRHPLLSAHVEDRPGIRLGFFRARDVGPVELAVVRRSHREWRSQASHELARPFDRSRAPLMRASLISGESGSTILLSFDHTIADGISAVRVLDDLVTALNGLPLDPLQLPPSQEEMIDRAVSTDARVAAVGPADPDPRMAGVGSRRPFTSTRPHVATTEWDATATARLVQRCHHERTTVHAAIVAVASVVRGREREEDFVRVVTPFEFRELIHAGPECVDYFTATRTGMAPDEVVDIWDQARQIAAQLKDARSAAGVAAVSAATRQLMPVDAGVDAAETFLTGGLSYEMLISNLGVQDVERSGPIRPEALWGPVLLCQVEGEFVTGITTYDGRLRMVAVGYAPTGTFLEKVRTALLDACA